MGNRRVEEIAATVAGCLFLLGACVGDNAAEAEFCDELQTVGPLHSIAQVDLDGDDPGATLSAALTVASASFSNLRVIAPKEIKSEATMLAEALTSLSEDFARTGGDLESLVDPVMVEQMEELVSPEFQAAGSKIEEFVLAECGLELFPNVTPSDE